MVVQDAHQCLGSCKNMDLSLWTTVHQISELTLTHGTIRPMCCILSSPQVLGTHTAMILLILESATSMMINQLKITFILYCNGSKNIQIIKIKVFIYLVSHMLEYMCHICSIKLHSIMRNIQMIQVFSNQT